MFVRIMAYGGYMDTISRGNAAEAAVLNALTRAGIGVLIPFGGGSSFDLAAVLPPNGEIARIQVKSGRVRKRCVTFNACSTDHGQGRLSYRGLADFIAVDVPELGRLFMVPVDDCPSFTGLLRLDTPRNNQRVGVRFADDYDLAGWLQSLVETGEPAAATALWSRAEVH
jgi:PD-(D/E)XK endonuclease